MSIAEKIEPVSGGVIHAPLISEVSNKAPLKPRDKLTIASFLPFGVGIFALGLISVIYPFFYLETISKELVTEALSSQPMSFEFHTPNTAFAFTLVGSLAILLVLFGIVAARVSLKYYGAWDTLMGWISVMALMMGAVGLIMGFVSVTSAQVTLTAPGDRARMIASLDVMNSHQQDSENWVFRESFGAREGKMVYEYSGKLEQLGENHYRYTFTVPEAVYEARLAEWKSVNGESVYKLEEEVKP